VHLERPVDAQPHYGQHLGDAAYWEPYVVEVLARHGVATRPLEVPFVGTFPTFLVGDVVVKLFGPGFDGVRSCAIELALFDAIGDVTEIPAPALIASGHLFDGEPRWPYIVSERVGGVALREVQLADGDAEAIAHQLGAIVDRLHAVDVPPAVAARDLIPDLRRDAPERLRRFGLPAHLVEQVAEFLADAAPATHLVHGDITADHVFVDGSRVTAIIDWGDALMADRGYELPAVYLDALRGRREWFAAFLAGARWPLDDLPRRGLQGILEFQFDAISAIAKLVDLRSVRTLDELAKRLFAVRRSAGRTRRASR